MPTCSNCQAEVSTAANTCPNCGAVFETPASSSTGQSGRTTSGTHPDQFGSQQLLRVAQGLAGLTIVCALVVLVIPQSVLGGSSTGVLLPAVVLLWLIIVGGLWRQTETGVGISIVGYGFATVLSALGTVESFLGLGGLRLLSVRPVDPASLLLRAIYSFQLSGGGTPRVRSISFLIAGVVGTVSLAAVTGLLVRNRDALVMRRATDAGHQSAASTGSLAGSERMVTLSGSVLAGGVVIVLAASLLGWHGFDSTTLGAKVISAGFPSLLAGVIGYVSVAHPAAFDAGINVPVVLIVGVVLPVAVTLDAVIVRRQTDWTPSVLWYPIGVVFVWFLALPIYLYRRHSKV